MRYYIVLVIGILSFFWGGQKTFAQQSVERPSWTYGYFKDIPNSYIEVVSYKGYDFNECKQKAAQIVIQRRGMSVGTNSNITFENGNIRVSGEQNLVVKARIIDEYVENLPGGGYMVYLLVQTAKNPTYSYECVRFSDEYPFSPRVFIPGMAQIHKGSTAKGIAFIVGEAAMIGGYVIADNMEQSNKNNAAASHNAKQKKDYLDKANTCVTAKNICIAGAAIVYAWNVIDGIVAKGKKHVLFCDANLQMTPYTTFDGGGLALRLKF